MMFGWCSSRRYLTSRTADMSRPSLNWPTLIFFMAILRPVASSRPGYVVRHQHSTTPPREKKKDNPDRRPHKYPLQLSGLSPCWQYVLRTPSLRGTRGHAPSVLSLCVGPLHCIHESSERSLRYSDVTGRTYADTYKLEATHDKRYTPL